MSLPFIAPGTETTPTQIVAPVLNPPDLRKFTRSQLKSGAAQMFRPNVRGTLQVDITMQGYNTILLHSFAADAVLSGGIGIIHQVTGDGVVSEAQAALRGERDMPRAFLSGNTHDSVHHRLETTPNTVMSSIGPRTFYAPLIEFGLARHFGFGPRPFMSMAFAAVVPFHLRALHELVGVATGPAKAISQNPYAGPTNSWIQQFRAALYDLEKQAGDLIPLFDLPFLRAPRAAAIGTARVLGDIQATIGNAVGARVIRRLTGQVTGRLIGIGANTVFANRSVNADFNFANRLYNRRAGAAVSKFVGSTPLGRIGR